MGLCRFGDRDCPLGDPPEDMRACQACATLEAARVSLKVHEKSNEVQRELAELQRQTSEFQSMVSISTILGTLPYEEKELQEKLRKILDKKIKKLLEGFESSE